MVLSVQSIFQEKYFVLGVRCLAGFKDSAFFTTNSSESLNHVIKQEVQWKESHN